MGRGEATLLVERLELIAKRLAEVYRSELQDEMRRSQLGFHIEKIDCYEGTAFEDHFFNIRYNNADGSWDAGILLPFRRRAFCGRPGIEPSMDPAFKVIKEVLERRGYSVEYKPKDTLDIVEELRGVPDGC